MNPVSRLKREAESARKSNVQPGADIRLQPVSEESLFKWTSEIDGPSETPFAGGTYTVDLTVPSDYPIVPPTAKFPPNKVFHPNVRFDTGEICLDILKASWSPAWTLQSVCRAIQTLMAHPEHDSPLNCDAGNMLREKDTEAYESMVRYYAVRHARLPEAKW
jgi:peroxin-4